MPDHRADIIIRPMCEEDLEAVVAIEVASFSHPWTRRHFLDELDSPYGFPLVALTPDGCVAGYLCLKLVLDEAEILEVAVSSPLRGQGVGRTMIEKALAFCRVRGGALVSLEVRVDNDAAITLYRRLGFREIGRRKGYYDNGVDAIVMEYTFERHVEESDAV
jgi:[ribosomal protein S18]-alanine N-acetyltransferase